MYKYIISYNILLTYIHTHIHTYTHTYIHTYIHTYSHTYIHAYFAFKSTLKVMILTTSLNEARLKHVHTFITNSINCGTRITVCDITDFTVDTRKIWKATAFIRLNLICTVTIISTRIWITIINISFTKTTCKSIYTIAYCFSTLVNTCPTIFTSHQRT